MPVVTDQEASERYRQRLEEYCSKHVLNPKSGFCCEHGEACHSSVGGKRNSFAAGQLSYVGDGYAAEIDGRPMRILVVPMQVGRGADIDMDRRRGQVLECKKPSRRNPHMRAVVEVLQVLFGLEPGGVVEKINNNSHVLEAYAMANSVLCSNLSGSPTDAMLENCREHLRQTIALLKPTIIVTQGNVPRDTFRKAVDRYKPTIYDRVGRATIKGVQAVCCEILLPSPGYYGPEGHFCQVAVPALERARRLALGKTPDEPPAAPPAPSDEQSAAAGDASNGAAKIVPGLDWYIIHTYSGFEKKVKESLRTRADSFGFEKKVGEILIPTEDVVEMRNGKKVTTERLLYPGYVLVQLALDDELWHVIKNTPRVTGFVGGGHDPQPLTENEVNQILNRQIASAERPRPKMEFARNDRVKIVDGPFSGFSGTVEEVNDRSTVKVMVTIFGRGTPVELEYFQVEKER